jgi:acyl-coenzyme A thioesterase PaaI-like protein
MDKTAEEIARADEANHLTAIEHAIMEANAQEVTISVGSYTRTIKERVVTFRCEWCSAMGTEMRLPGPPPRYHTECKQEAQNAIAKSRMKQMRERRAKS